MKKTLILLLMMLPMMAMAQKDEWCRDPVIQSVNEKQILICYRFDVRTCFVRLPRVAPVMADNSEVRDRPLGMPESMGIGDAQRKREVAKQACRDAMNAGDMAQAFTHSLDMLYWATEMGANGAYGVELAAPYTAPGLPSVFEQIKQDIENAILLRLLYDLPNVQPDE